MSEETNTPTQQQEAIRLEYSEIHLGTCPNCRKNHTILDKGEVYGCTNYPECTFTIRKEILKTKISSTVVKQLLSDTRITTSKLHFKKETDSGEMSEFDCHLVLKKENEKWDVKFEFNVPLGKCPTCKEGQIIELNKVYKCNNNKCGSFCYKSYNHVPLKPSHLLKLLNKPYSITLNIPSGKFKRKVVVYVKDIFKQQNK